MELGGGAQGLVRDCVAPPTDGSSSSSAAKTEADAKKEADEKKEADAKKEADEKTEADEQKEDEDEFAKLMALHASKPPAAPSRPAWATQALNNVLGLQPGPAAAAALPTSARGADGQTSIASLREGTCSRRVDDKEA